MNPWSSRPRPPLPGSSCRQPQPAPPPREPHDVVAHHLALANAQAKTAARVLHGNPAQAQQLVDQLTVTTGEALREMKATVGPMRQHDDATPMEPAPGLAQLPRLLDAFATGGLGVAVTVDGEARPLPPGTDLTGYPGGGFTVIAELPAQ
ncbi:histidine kinase [Streptomyces sp. NPDC098789]|uniref:histidine kinase n=1 Tax=Streptomyces sp. NPDC098789 TaxID=3366098 RepID=UPI0038155CE0